MRNEFLFFLCPSMSQRRGLVARSFPDDWRERLYPQQLRGSIRLHPSRRVHNPLLVSLLNITFLFKAQHSCFFFFFVLIYCTSACKRKNRFSRVHASKILFSSHLSVCGCLLMTFCGSPALILCGPLWQVVFWEDHSAWLWEAPSEPAEQTRNIPGEGERDH